MLVNFDDEELFEEIKSHLGPLINRLIFHVQANDIFHGEVQTQYPFAFEMAKIAGEELSAILEMCIRDRADIVNLRVHSFGSIEFLTRTPLAINAGLAMDIVNFIWVRCV